MSPTVSVCIGVVSFITYITVSLIYINIYSIPMSQLEAAAAANQNAKLLLLILGGKITSRHN